MENQLHIKLSILRKYLIAKKEVKIIVKVTISHRG